LRVPKPAVRETTILQYYSPSSIGLVIGHGS